MATFGQIQAKASKRLKDANNEAVSISDVATTVNDAIRHWSKRDLGFNQFSETITLVENDPILPALSVTPQSLNKYDGIVLDYASTRWPLSKISAHEYDEMNIEGQGIPFVYCYRNGQYEMYYYPDQAYSADVRGFKAYNDLVDNADTNDFTIHAENLILYETLARLYAEFRQDPKMEEYYIKRAGSEYRQRMALTNRQRGTGRLTVKGI